jgi:hypothetical protein
MGVIFGEYPFQNDHSLADLYLDLVTETSS